MNLKSEESIFCMLNDDNHIDKSAYVIMHRSVPVRNVTNGILPRRICMTFILCFVSLQVRMKYEENVTEHSV